MPQWNGDRRTIPECCQKLLAHMLYNSVDYIGSGERAACDWDTAARLLGNHPELVNTAMVMLGTSSWFRIGLGFNMQTTVVDSGGFFDACGRVFWENLRHWACEIPNDKYGNGRGFG